MLNQRSLNNLKGVHPALDLLVHALDIYLEDNEPTLGIVVTEGLRTMERQKQLMAAGASQTLNSRHLTGHAVDLAVTVGGEIRWDWPLYKKMSDLMKMMAKQMETPIVWGGDWKTLKDGPHIELDRSVYP